MLCSVALLYKFAPIVETAQKGLMHAGFIIPQEEVVATLNACRSCRNLAVASAASKATSKM